MCRFFKVALLAWREPISYSKELFICFNPIWTSYWSYVSSLNSRYSLKSKWLLPLMHMFSLWFTIIFSFMNRTTWIQINDHKLNLISFLNCIPKSNQWKMCKIALFTIQYTFCNGKKLVRATFEMCTFIWTSRIRLGLSSLWCETLHRPNIFSHFSLSWL